jgi:hypothetical protein
MTYAPSPDSLWIGKGRIYWKKTGDAGFRDLGECPEAEYTPSGDKLDYFSNRLGVKKKIKSIVVSQSASLRIRMDEVVAENVALAYGGTVVEASDGTKTFGMMTSNSVSGTIKIIGYNEVGKKLKWVGAVTFAPSGSFNFITDEWGGVEATGEVLADENGAFGVVTFGENLDDEVSA